MADLHALLAPLLRVSNDPAELEAVAGDKSGLRGAPDIVAWPRTTDEVAALLRAANEHAFIVVPRGAGTGRCGGAVAERGGVICDLSDMDRLLEVDRRERIARAQPGLLLGALQDAAEEAGLWFPRIPPVRGIASSAAPWRLPPAVYAARSTGR